MITASYETINEVNDWITIRQASVEKRAGYQNLYRYIHNHKLPTRRVGTTIFVHRSDLNEYDNIRRIR